MLTYPHPTATTYEHRVFGAWLGKNIGGTLGAPVEGRRELLHLDGYLAAYTEPLPNDDLDLQLLWLAVLERRGLALNSLDLADAWLTHVRFPFNEYGYALRNLRRGLLPPLSGAHDNPFGDCMGAPIRTEIWAAVAPGQPELAAHLAYQDAIVDHHGEGVWGAMFWAVLEALAFERADLPPHDLLDQALAFIPPRSQVRQAVQDLQRAHVEGVGWLEARKQILERHGNHEDFTHAPQNITFAALGWLYGEDFGDALLKTVNCGYDTDSSGAMIGALLGILGGREAIPPEWSDPIGERVAVSPAVGGFAYPRDLHELTERTCQVAARLQQELAGPSPLARERRNRLQPHQLRELWRQSPYTVGWGGDDARGTGGGLQVKATYLQGPGLTPGEVTSVRLSLHNPSSWPWTGALRSETPGVQLQGAGQHDLHLAPGETRELTLQVIPRPGELSPRLTLHLEQVEGGLPWREQLYTLAFVPRRAWQLLAQGDNTPLWTGYLDGGTLDLETLLPDAPHGKLIARTTLGVPSSREARFMLTSKTATELHLDGALLFTAPGDAPLMPSPHMTMDPGFEHCSGDALLTAGEHTVEVHFDSRSPDGTPTRLDLTVGSLTEPRFQHFTDIQGL